MWLVLGMTRPTKRTHLIHWLRKRVQDLDFDSMETVTVWHQRRFGWGDVRTTPEILAARQQEARLRPRTLRELGKQQARRELAKAELRLRQRQTTASANPILATSVGQRALKARKICSDTEPLQKLMQASKNIPALPGPPPLLATEDKPGRLSTTPPEDNSGEDSEGEASPFPRTVFTWGGTFAIYQNQKPGKQEQLEALTRGADLDFCTFLYKYLYAVKQVTPPCPQLDPQLLTDIKELGGLHTGKRAVEALTAKEEDMVDEVLGRPPVVRCRVCHKPSETGVHPHGQARDMGRRRSARAGNWVRPHRGAAASHPS